MKQQVQQPLQLQKAWVLADQGVVSASAFATNLLLARALGLAGFGQFSGMVLAQLFVLSLYQAATGSVYQVLYPAMAEGQRHSYHNGLFYLQALVCGVLALAGFSVVWLFALPAVFVWVVVSILLGLQQDYLRKVLLTQQRAKHALYIDALTNLLQLAALLLLWQYQTLTPASAWMCIGLSFVPSVGVGIGYLRLGNPAVAPMQFAWRQQRQHSGWLLLTALVQWGAGNYYVVAAGWWLGAAALGALRLGQYIFGLLNVLLQALENYALPLAARHRATSPREFHRLLKTVFINNLLLVLPLLLVLSGFAKPILQLAGGNGYTAYSFVIYALSALYLLVALGYPVRIGIRAGLYNRQFLTGYVIAACFSLLTAPLLIQNWQLHGVLAGMFLTQLITLIYWILILKQENILAWKSYTLS
ncbi:hypothetical protein C7N43_24355 [Sphingobacteriales bacterium UPWRP_1]|nr:hypothetical protein BVG80_16695 [Sphingobacteriales bacterium TSM_CSM]PSJ74389.1 hypothetical protein C7N43_24355 [Sphingobacteriales bacterium UPWRP_1]